LGRVEEVWAVENTVDLAGKDESEIRRVTKEIIIGLWPLLGAGFQADEAQVARLKEWLDEVRTWNVDRSGR
jgi:hypothetical protein